MKHLIAVAGTAACLLFLPAAVAQAAPSNDAFASATTLTLGVRALVDDLGATSEASEPDKDDDRAPGCASVAESADCAATTWFTFTAPATQTYVVDTCDGSGSLDTTLEVFTGSSLATLAAVGYSDDVTGAPAGSPCPGGPSLVSFSATAGTPYRIRLAGFAATAGTAYLRLSTTDVTATTVPVDTSIGRQFSFSSAAALPFYGTVPYGERRTASFTFSAATAAAADPAPTFACAFDGAAPSPCTSPASYPVSADAGVRHEFRVQATSGANVDSTPAVQRFVIDTTPPATAITGGPAEASTTTLPVTITARSADAPSAAQKAVTFSCSVDGTAVYTNANGSTCGIPLTLPAGLCDGVHAVGVSTIDVAGNLPSATATRSFTTTGASACSAPGAATPLAATSSSTGSGGTVVSFKGTFSTGGRYADAGFDFGPTTEYGDHVPVEAPPSDTAQALTAGAITTPGTTYHYRARIRTASGTAVSPDMTVTTATPAAGQAAPTLVVGPPVMAGPSALAVPVTVANGTPSKALMLSLGAATTASQSGAGLLLDTTAATTATTTGSKSFMLPVTDLVPGSTVHLRARIQETPSGSPLRYVLSDDQVVTIPADPAPPSTTGPTGPTGPSGPSPSPGAGSAGTPAATPTTTPPMPIPPVPTPPSTRKPFKLTTALVSVARFSRKSKSLKVTVKGLPGKARLTVSVKGAKRLGTATATLAAKATSRTIVLKLGKKARAALKAKRLKKLAFTVSVTPAGGKRQTVVRTVKLR